MPPSPKHDRRIHPGSGRRRGLDHPKGRQVDPAALAEVQALLGDRERRRDLLIEHLHLLQDHFGCLHARHLAALAEEMRLALVEVYEVASFYAHFDIVMDDEKPPPALTVRVCDSLSCELAGAVTLLSDLQSRLGADVRVVRAPCMGGCDKAPVVAIGHALHEHATPASVAAAIAAGETHAPVPEFVGLHNYRVEGGYHLLQACLAGERTRDQVIEALEHSGLRGLGGAGFPTGRKWRLVRQEPAPRLMAVNGDEGEPGTFKDRYFLETDPHRFLEGHADRRLGGRGGRDLHLPARRIPAMPAILESEIAAIEAAGLAPHAQHSPAPRRRRLYLRRRIGDARKHRGQARAAAAPPAVSGPGRALRPADSDQQHRDALLGARHRRKGRRLVHRARAATGARGCAPSRSRAGCATRGSSSPRPASPHAS